MVWRKLKNNLKLLPSWLLRIFIGVFAIFSLYQGDVLAAILFIIMLIVSLLPAIIDVFYNIRLHWLHDLAFSFLIFAHMAGFAGFYNAIPLWDDFSHIIGTMTVTMVVFSFIYAYCLKGNIKLTLSMVAFFSACIAMAIGAVWEIIEFIWDNLMLFAISYGFMQNGLFDTMLDLTWDFSGSIISTVAMLYYVRKASEKDQKEFFGPIVKIISARKGMEN